MISIYESTSGYIRAALTGLGGVYTLGALGAYDIHKKQAAQKALALANKDPKAYYDSDSTGSAILHGIGGSIPIVGIIPNIIAYKKRMDAEEALSNKVRKSLD